MYSSYTTTRERQQRIRRATSVSLILCVIAALTLAFSATAGAQTVSFVSRGDTALLVAKMPQCTTACPDSIRRTWSVYGQQYARVVKPKTTDTLRVLRSTQPADATLQYLPYKATRKTIAVPALVIAWYSSHGARLTALTIPERDSIKAVAFMQYADGRTARIPSPMTWTLPPNIPATSRVVGSMKDTLWLVAK